MLVVAAADYPLDSLGIQIREHWKRHRPKMYAELEKNSHLLASVYAAQELTNDLMDSPLDKRMPHHLPFDPRNLIEQVSPPGDEPRKTDAGIRAVAGNPR